MPDHLLPARIIVTCGKRLGPWLEQEIVALGFKPKRTFSTGVELRGTLADCVQLNLKLRCASQVLYSIQEFFVDGPEALYTRIVRFPWEQWIAPDGYFSVTSNVHHPTINNELFVNVRIKDAIADRMRQSCGRRPDSGAELRGLVVHLYWSGDGAELFIDTSGETLAKHGYRKIPGKAPMLEALAAATVYATKWDPSTAFLNPMCGSGTLAIEAALIASNRYPGLFRNNYSFMHILGFDRSIYDAARSALNQSITQSDAQVVASDISADAIMISKANATTAGVAELIQFVQCPFEATPVPENKGVVIFNPEYGERLGDEERLNKTYAEIGDFLKKSMKGYRGYIFTGNMELAKKVGLRASRRTEFFNGTIDCRLLEYELYEGTRRKFNPEPSAQDSQTPSRPPLPDQ